MAALETKHQSDPRYHMGSTELSPRRHRRSLRQHRLYGTGPSAGIERLLSKVIDIAFVTGVAWLFWIVDVTRIPCVDHQQIPAASNMAAEDSVNGGNMTSQPRSAEKLSQQLGSDKERQQDLSSPLADAATGRTLDTLQQIESNNPHHPIHWNLFKKWAIVVVYCTLQVFVSMTSTAYVSIEEGIQTQFGGSIQFLSGAAGSTALSNVAGTVADLFGDEDGAGQPSKPENYRIGLTD
ncbi:MAG: hypothetical protein LQ340_006092 [Diploschistes diacapsis]|nr:MAG: hypothetical protein LQ340_006092 [Diploschistes diacapsis]